VSLVTDREKIAQAAAALIVEQQIDDWQFARRKAARQLGFDERTPLPDRDQLEAALRGYAQLYLADEQDELVDELRAEAREWMERFAEFQPELTGPLAEGWAYPGCEIRLELLADDPKTVEIALLNLNIDFGHVSSRPSPSAPEVLGIDGETGPIRLVIQDYLQRRNRKRDRARLRLAELRA
jgi:phosphoglycolate phosphatase-like HAD superfamily hydrolase